MIGDSWFNYKYGISLRGKLAEFLRFHAIRLYLNQNK